MQRFHLLSRQTGSQQFFVDLVETNFVEFIDSHGDIHDFVGSSEYFCNTGEEFAVIDFNCNADAKAREHFVNDLHQFDLVEKRIATHHVSIALIEFAIASFLRTVGAPNGLDLETLEGKLEFFAVLHYIACKRHSEVIAQSFLAKLSGKGSSGVRFILFGGNRTCEVSAVENFEEQFVAFFSIFPHKGGEVFHRRGFDLRKTIKTVDTADGVEDVVASCHFDESEIARTFGYRGFLCHRANESLEVGGGMPLFCLSVSRVWSSKRLCSTGKRFTSHFSPRKSA